MNVRMFELTAQHAGARSLSLPYPLYPVATLLSSARSITVEDSMAGFGRLCEAAEREV